MKDSQRKAMYAKMGYLEQMKKMPWKKESKQVINIKWPAQRSELYLRNKTVHVNPVLNFEGRLDDGRPVNKIGKRWTYIP